MLLLKAWRTGRWDLGSQSFNQLGRANLPERRFHSLSGKTLSIPKWKISVIFLPYFWLKPSSFQECCLLYFHCALCKAPCSAFLTNISDTDWQLLGSPRVPLSRQRELSPTRLISQGRYCMSCWPCADPLCPVSFSLEQYSRCCLMSDE